MIFVVLSKFFQENRENALYCRAFSTKIDDFRCTVDIFQENRENALYCRAFSTQIDDFRCTVDIFQENRVR